MSADFEANIAESYRPFPKLHETLLDLSRDYLLGVITNGRADFQKRTLAALGIAQHFQVVLISESEGVRKPDREIFQRALRRLACDAAQAVYWGITLFPTAPCRVVSHLEAGSGLSRTIC